jgi:hypothetical protein
MAFAFDSENIKYFYYKLQRLGRDPHCAKRATAWQPERHLQLKCWLWNYQAVRSNIGILNLNLRE